MLGFLSQLMSVTREVAIVRFSTSLLVEISLTRDAVYSPGKNSFKHQYMCG